MEQDHIFHTVRLLSLCKAMIFQWLEPITWVISISGAVLFLFTHFKKRALIKRSEQDLTLYFEEEKDGDKSYGPKSYRQNYVPTQGVDRPPEEEDEPKENEEAANKQPLIRFFMKQVF